MVLVIVVDNCRINTLIVVGLVVVVEVHVEIIVVKVERIEGPPEEEIAIHAAVLYP